MPETLDVVLIVKEVLLAIFCIEEGMMDRRSRTEDKEKTDTVRVNGTVRRVRVTVVAGEKR
jgi:hypothetical protein